MLHQFLHWAFVDAGPWVAHTARTHNNWIFPIAFLVAFSESFVGVSFLVPGTIILVSLGAVIGASGMGFFSAWAGAVLGSILGDWISYWIGFH